MLAEDRCCAFTCCAAQLCHQCGLDQTTRRWKLRFWRVLPTRKVEEGRNRCHM